MCLHVSRSKVIGEDLSRSWSGHVSTVAWDVSLDVLSQYMRIHLLK